MRRATRCCVAIGSDLYHSFDAQGRAHAAHRDCGGRGGCGLQPGRRLVGVHRGNDLYVVDVDHRRERRLTTDGGPQMLNGKLDWVYQEEVYGRGNYRAYWWSPDSRRLAFLQLDERPVPEFTIVDHIPRRLDRRDVATTRSPATRTRWCGSASSRRRRRACTGSTSTRYARPST